MWLGFRRTTTISRTWVCSPPTPTPWTEPFLRPSNPGVLIIITDYVAAAGSGTRDTQSLHRIDPEVIKREVTAAGFMLEAEGNALMNPSDDLAVRSRQGASQVMLRFRKPRYSWLAPAKKRGLAPPGNPRRWAGGLRWANKQDFSALQWRLALRLLARSQEATRSLPAGRPRRLRSILSPASIHPETRGTAQHAAIVRLQKWGAGVFGQLEKSSAAFNSRPTLLDGSIIGAPPWAFFSTVPRPKRGCHGVACVFCLGVARRSQRERGAWRAVARSCEKR